MPDCDPCNKICYKKKVKCKAPTKAGSACTGCMWAVASSLVNIYKHNTYLLYKRTLSNYE